MRNEVHADVHADATAAGRPDAESVRPLDQGDIEYFKPPHALSCLEFDAFGPFLMMVPQQYLASSTLQRF